MHFEFYVDIIILLISSMFYFITCTMNSPRGTLVQVVFRYLAYNGLCYANVCSTLDLIPNWTNGTINEYEQLNHFEALN